MFNKNLLTALLVIAGATASQARVVSPKQIPAAYTALADAAPETQLTYSIKLPSSGQAALDAKMLEIAQQGGEWLTDEELVGYTRASDDHVEAVKSYLTKFGGKNFTADKWGDQLTVTHSVQEANAAWKASLKHFKHSKTNKTILRTPEYTVPTELYQAIENVQSFTSFSNPQRSIPIEKRRWTKEQLVERAQDASSVCQADNITPACIKSQYGSDSYTAKPQDGTLDAIVMGYIGEYVSESDLTKYLQTYRPDLKGYKIDIETAAGGTNDQSNPGTEASLDVDMVASVAGPLNVEFLSYGTSDISSDSFFGESLAYVLNSGKNPGVITLSYADLESSFSQSDAKSLCNTVQKLAAKGTTVVAASGDNGVNGNQPGYSECSQSFNSLLPSGCPYVLSVGATALQSDGSEAPTNGYQFWSGAGFSDYFSAPSYQAQETKSYINSIGSLDNGKYNKAGRGYPDLTALGWQVSIAVNGEFSTVGGTSAAAPIVAGHIALLNNYRQLNGKGRVGWFNPKLYANPSALQDLTTGKSGGCNEDGTLYFPAGKGWDPASGLGTPKFKAWQALN